MSERHFGTPRSRRRFRFDILDISRENTDFKSRRSRGQQNIVGMPIQGGDRGSNGFFDVFGYPPIIFLLKIANRNQSGPGTHGKLVFFGTPFDTGRSAVDPQ